MDGVPSVTEAEFQSAVIDLAHVHGWRVAHFRPAQTQSGRWLTPVAADGKGFPDLVLAHPKRGVLFRELKTDDGRLSKWQRQWLYDLRQAGADAAVWRPCDWPTIEQVLARSR